MALVSQIFTRLSKMAFDLQPSCLSLQSSGLKGISLKNICVSVLPARVSVHNVHAMPWRPGEDVGSSLNWTYSWLWTAMWVLGIVPRSSARAASAPHHDPCLQPHHQTLFTVFHKTPH